MTIPRRAALAVALVALLAGCTADPPAGTAPAAPVLPAPAFRLVAFDSCADVLDGLKAAAKQVVMPWGLNQDSGMPDGVRAKVGGPVPATAFGAMPESARAPGDPGSDYSGTNNHEAGVDEPDLVKTDGHRIVTISDGLLRVVDPVTRTLTGSVSFSDDAAAQYGEATLLLHGDRALVLIPRAQRLPGSAMGGKRLFGPVADLTMRLVMVDLSGPRPSVTGSYTMDGSLVDARQIDGTARIVVRTQPRIEFPYRETGTDEMKVAANRALIDRSKLDDWLPHWQAQNGAEKSSGVVDCGAVRRPDTYSGTSLLTVLSFGIGEPFGSGDPTTIVADGDFVYSNGASLYVANDQTWRTIPRPWAGVSMREADLRTEIYRFDISGAGAPRYVAAGSVPGSLLNQYAMSEFDGHLRVAALMSNESSVFVLRASDMTRVGLVDGLGKNERIFAVRFAGPVGYVVTFRQTDPLYVVDLHDPAAPAVRGELKINGYSSYLHPIDGDRLIGIGQDADANGRVLGMQISLFDVSDLANPRRVAQHLVKNGWSEAENDPHAFLYWPASGLLVVPSNAKSSEALGLRVTASGFDEVGTAQHPSSNFDSLIRRSMMIDGSLWTLSNAGMAVSDATTMRRLAFVRFA